MRITERDALKTGLIQEIKKPSPRQHGGGMLIGGDGEDT